MPARNGEPWANIALATLCQHPAWKIKYNPQEKNVVNQNLRPFLVPHSTFVVQLSDGALARLDASSGEQLWCREPLAESSAGWLLGPMVVAPDGCTITTCATCEKLVIDRSTRTQVVLVDAVYGLVSWRVKLTYPPDDKETYVDAAYAPDSLTIAVACPIGCLMIDARDGTILFNIREVRQLVSVKFSPCGQRVLVLHGLDDIVFMLNAVTGAELWQRNMARDWDPDYYVVEVASAAYVVVTYERFGNMMLLDTEDGHIVWHWDLRESELALGTDRRTIKFYPIIDSHLFLVKFEREGTRCFFTVDVTSMPESHVGNVFPESECDYMTCLLGTGMVAVKACPEMRDRQCAIDQMTDPHLDGVLTKLVRTPSDDMLLWFAHKQIAVHGIVDGQLDAWNVESGEKLWTQQFLSPIEEVASGFARVVSPIEHEDKDCKR